MSVRANTRAEVSSAQSRPFARHALSREAGQDKRSDPQTASSMHRPAAPSQRRGSRASLSPYPNGSRMLANIASTLQQQVVSFTRSSLVQLSLMQHWRCVLHCTLHRRTDLLGDSTATASRDPKVQITNNTAIIRCSNNRLSLLYGAQFPNDTSISSDF